MDMKRITGLLRNVQCTRTDLEHFETHLVIKDADITLDDLDDAYKSVRILEDVIYEAIINLRKEETQNEKL